MGDRVVMTSVLLCTRAARPAPDRAAISDIRAARGRTSWAVLRFSRPGSLLEKQSDLFETAARLHRDGESQSRRLIEALIGKRLSTPRLYEFPSQGSAPAVSLWIRGGG